MHHNNKKLLIILFSLGVVLLIISTYLYSFNIPNKHDRIDRLKYSVDVGFNNCERYVESMKGLQILQNQFNILVELEAPNETLDNVNYYLRDILVKALIEGKSCIENRDLTPKERSFYTSLDLEKAGDEYIKLAGIMSTGGDRRFKPKEFDEIKALEEKVETRKVVALLLQIMGLLINQLAVVLQLRKSN